MVSTVFVTLADDGYLSRAKRTIRDLRTTGQWHGQIVFVSVDGCVYDRQIEDGVVVAHFPRIDTSGLLSAIGPTGFPDTTDGRELSKLKQWEKLHVFDAYFKQWSRVVFLDAGLRVLDDVGPGEVMVGPKASVLKRLPPADAAPSAVPTAEPEPPAR